MSKEYKAIKNYIHNELGLTKEDIINVIRSDIRQCVERCMRNTYGDDNNLERWIKVMVENKDILDKVRMKGMNQGIWLAVQELAHDGRWTQAAEELVSSCGLTEDECRELQEESGSFNDEMLDFINSVFGHEDMINNSITLENIGYHKIGSIFKYNIGSKEVELEVVESSDASCEGCVFNNSKNYYCKDTHCIDVDRKDDIDVIYKEVKRS